MRGRELVQADDACSVAGARVELTVVRAIFVLELSDLKAAKYGMQKP